MDVDHGHTNANKEAEHQDKVVEILDFLKGGWDENSEESGKALRDAKSPPATSKLPVTDEENQETPSRYADCLLLRKATCMFWNLAIDCFPFIFGARVLPVAPNDVSEASDTCGVGRDEA
jgi:hypothetical protein